MLHRSKPSLYHLCTDAATGFQELDNKVHKLEARLRQESSHQTDKESQLQIERLNRSLSSVQIELQTSLVERETQVTHLDQTLQRCAINACSSTALITTLITTLITALITALTTTLMLAHCYCIQCLVLCCHPMCTVSRNST